MKHTLYYFLLLIILLGCSTEKAHNNYTLTVNVDSAINISTTAITKVVLNKDGNPLFLGYISGFTPVNSDEIIIATHAKPLMKFNIYTGNMLSEVGRIGRAANEYSALFDMWIEQDTLLAAYDINTKQILRYNINTCKFVNSSLLIENADSNPFSMLCPLGDGQFVGKSTYKGMPTNELALYDNDYRFIKQIGDDKFNSGLKLGRNFAQYKDEVLYWKPFGCDIYNITKEKISLKYKFDFVNMNIDPSKFDAEYKLIEHMNANPTKYAGVIANYSENDSFVCFRFSHNRNKYLAVHDKSLRETKSYLFSDSPGSSLLDIFIVDNNVVLFYATPNENYIKTIDISELMTR